MKDDFRDRKGFCRTVSQQDIDLIRVEAENIESPDDKVYLLKSLYKYIDLVEAALEMLDDPKTALKVKQKKSELLRLQENLQETREYIMRYRIQPEQYGLFIKYPRGFEG